jgi:lysozyme
MVNNHDGLALAVEIIRRFEGFSPVPYLCPAGHRTIGYGHVLYGGASEPQFLTRETADALLLEDAMRYRVAVRRLVRVPLAPWQEAALVSFSFNLGAGALQRSTLRQCLNRGDYHDVPRELKRWVFAGGQKLKGLVRRREAEAHLWGDPNGMLPWA